MHELNGYVHVGAGGGRLNLDLKKILVVLSPPR